MTKTLRKVQRGLDVMDNERGYVRDGDVGTYLTRVAEILGVKHYYVHTTAQMREVTGQRYRKIDGSGLQYWLSDTAANSYPLSTPGRG